MDFDQEALREVQETRLLIDQLDDWLFEMIKPFLGDRVLDVGSGMGNYIRLMLDREMVIGIDLSSECVDFVKEEYREYNNIYAIECDVSSSDFLDLQSYLLDTVLSVNVLEHIEDDVEVLRQISEVLINNGHLILIVPAHMSLYGTMDSSIGHYRRYTIKGLGEKLKSVGFKPVYQKYINPLGAVGWFVNGRIFRRKTPPAGQLKTFNRMMPLVKALDRMYIPFGISLLSVSQKNNFSK